MIGAIIGAATSVAGGILGAISSSEKRKNARKILENRRSYLTAARNEAVYKPAGQSASSQYYQNAYDEGAKDMVAKAEGNKAVIGGTDEAVSNTKNTVTQGKATLMAKLAAQEEQEKDKKQEYYDEQIGNVDNAIVKNEQDSAKYAEQASSDVMKAGMKLASTDIDAHMDGKGGVFENMFGLYKNKKAND